MTMSGVRGKVAHLQQDAEVLAAREPTGTAPVPTVDVEQLPYAQLTALDTPETDAQVYCKHHAH